MSLFTFGAGEWYAQPITDAYGNAIASGTPVKLGAVQEMSLEFSGDTKELYSSNQFALVIARGKVKISGKVKGASINGNTLNSLFFGQTMAAGTMASVYTDLTGSAIPAQTPQLVAAPPNGGAWQADLGVVDANGVPFARVAASPQSGEYVCAAGAYTFTSADAGNVVFVNYTYTTAASKAQRISIKNLPMGAAPCFRTYMQTTFQGKRTLAVLYSTVATKLVTFATKLDDFSVPELDFSGQADASNNVADIYLSE